MKTINIRLSGGLGNQLYQFAFAYYILINKGYQRINIDKTNFDKYDEGWGYLLDLIIDFEKLSQIISYDNKLLLTFRLAKILPLISMKVSKLGFISDKNSNILFTNQELSPNIYLDGYFETIQNNINYKKLLKNILIDDLYIDLNPNIAIINIRGGAYSLVGEKFKISQTYYLKTIENLKKINNNIIFNLISDDIDYSEKLLSNIKFDNIDKPHPFNNFQKIVSAKYKILSFSTFSIWAGILSCETDMVYYHPDIMERKWK